MPPVMGEDSISGAMAVTERPSEVVSACTFGWFERRHGKPLSENGMPSNPSAK